jgi:RNA polymerase sigma factor (sigma-70 family)
MGTGSLTEAPWPRHLERAHAVTEPDSMPALVGRAANGDQGAWNEIVDRYTNLLWSVGRAHRLDTADISDVVQTTWLRLLENLTRIRDPERLPGWLATTARRECVSLLRKSGRESVLFDENAIADAADEVADPVDHLLLVEERDAALWQCFFRLPERCQHLLRVLMSVDPPNYAEIGEAFGLPVGSIGPTRMRCVQRLRDLARETGYPFNTDVEGTWR